MSRRRREAARKWIGVQSPFNFSISPRFGAAFVENGDPDHANIFRIVVFFGRVRFANRTEPKRGDRFSALAKPFNYELRVRCHQIAAFAQRSLATVDNVKTVDRENNLKAQVGFVTNNDRIPSAFFANDKPAVANDDAGKKASALV